MQLAHIRNICLLGLPLLLILSLFCYHSTLFAQSAINLWLNQQLTANWREYIYIVSLTANIGYFTNFIAIKMLFKPYEKTAFGHQGLIPKNQPKLAQALSDTLSDHFLSSAHWQEYLHQSQLITKSTHSLHQYCRDWLENPASSKVLQQISYELLTNNQQTVEQLLKQLQTHLVHHLAQKIEPQQLLTEGFNWLEKQFTEKPEQMENLIEPIIKTIAGNIPRISRHLLETIDHHIEKQDTFKRNFAKAARWSMNLSESDIQDYLFRMVASFEFRQTLFEGLQSLITEYQKRQLNNPAQSSEFKLEQLINKIINYQLTKVSINEVLIHQLNQFIRSSNCRALLIKIIDTLFPWLIARLNQPAVEKKVYQAIINVIEHIDLRELIKEKAAGFSPAQMEGIFHRMIKDQLIFIELLGALLGALSGLALINLKAFLTFSVLFAAYYLADRWFTSRQNKAS
ncbi:DUF445 family protein [Aliikangiella maris]|uniref:DUF445 family protein n=2 Tax=Aliikangiella maris TaxID=3162458 RepID=A0ABV2BTV5_9GAMM